MIEGLRFVRGSLLLFAISLTGCSEGRDPNAPTPTPAPVFRPWQGPDTFVMIIPKRMTAVAVRVSARSHCGAREFCQVHGWVDADAAATGYPMTDREAAHQSFRYAVNRTTGYEDAAYDCKLWPGSEPCL